MVLFARPGDIGSRRSIWRRIRTEGVEGRSNPSARTERRRDRKKAWMADSLDSYPAKRLGAIRTYESRHSFLAQSSSRLTQQLRNGICYFNKQRWASAATSSA